MFFREKLPVAMLSDDLVIESTAKYIEKSKEFPDISKMLNSILFKPCRSLPLPLSCYAYARRLKV